MKTAQTRTESDAGSLPLDRATEKRIIEALVFVSDEPITEEQIAHVLPGRSPEELRALLEEIESELSGGIGVKLILERLGFRPVFRYEKYRTEYASRAV